MPKFFLMYGPKELYRCMLNYQVLLAVMSNNRYNMLGSFTCLSYFLVVEICMKRRFDMLYKRGIYSFVLVLLLLPAISFSQSQEVREYTIMKGDTLWGISGKELNDNFLWPQIWEENPGIPNPDRVYPGQTLKIPLYLRQKESQEETSAVIKPEGREETVKEQMPVAETSVAVTKAKSKPPEHILLKHLVGKNLLMASGYITDTVRSVGRVDGSPSERVVFGNNDIIYIKTESPANIGDKFYIIRA